MADYDVLSVGLVSCYSSIMEPEAVSAEVVDTIRQFLKAELKPLDVANVDVKVALDHDGDPSLLVDVTYQDNDCPVDPKRLATLLTSLRNHLHRKGELRFPYIRHHFAENQKVAGYN